MIPPIVSVIMPVYNAESYLSKSIESILCQTFGDFEFIIVNDGSNDSTWEVIQSYACKDNRIIAINQENIGLTKSLNRCISMSRGEFIARQDADDKSRRDRLEVQLSWMKYDKYDMCCSRTWLVSERKKSPGWSYWIPKGILMLKQNPFIHGTFFMRKDKLIKVGCYNQKYYYAQDYDLMVRWKLAGLNIKYLREDLYQTIQMEGSISNVYNQKQEFFKRDIRKKWRKNFISYLLSYNFNNYFE
jgi:glycosyltransferase involved in cell wall biosynthesis